MNQTSLKKNTRFDSLKENTNLFKSRRGRARRPNNSHEKRPSRFISNKLPKKEIFNLETSNFPDLGNKQNPSTQNVQDFSHIKNIKEPKPVKPKTNELKEGWIRFAKINGHWYKEEYINPENNLEKIKPLCGVLERFQQKRYMLNELLGDMSPYWGKIYEFDSDYESDSENQ